MEPSRLARFSPAAVRITCRACGYAVPTADRCAICRSPLVKSSRLVVLMAALALLAIAAAVVRYLDEYGHLAPLHRWASGGMAPPVLGRRAH
jgi:hypothetical protein